jgi:hypothetical protein
MVCNTGVFSSESIHFHLAYEVVDRNIDNCKCLFYIINFKYLLLHQVVVPLTCVSDYDHLCGLVVRVTGYSPGFDSQHCQIF